MSGGVAYVYDPKARFGELCNMSMVELEPVGIASADKDAAGRRTAGHERRLQRHG